MGGLREHSNAKRGGVNESRFSEDCVSMFRERFQLSRTSFCFNVEIVVSKVPALSLPL